MKKFLLSFMAVLMLAPMAAMAEGQIVVKVDPHHHHRVQHCYWRHHHRHCYWR
jgi:hypothetical protein